ncbi:MAG: hypothetical protein ACE14M_08535 [Terriglobales bacterium]
MPWPSDLPLYNFNEFSILLNARPEYGVYALIDASGQPILIDAGSILTDLRRLRERDEREFGDRPPVSFSYMVAPMEEAIALKKKFNDELATKKMARGA